MVCLPLEIFDRAKSKIKGAEARMKRNAHQVADKAFRFGARAVGTKKEGKLQ